MVNRESQCIWLFSTVFDNKNQHLVFKRLRAAKLVVSASVSQSGGPGFESRINWPLAGIVLSRPTWRSNPRPRL